MNDLLVLTSRRNRTRRDEDIHFPPESAYYGTSHVHIHLDKLVILLSMLQSYLVALVVGDLVSADIGPRSKVWTGMSMA